MEVLNKLKKLRFACRRIIFFAFFFLYLFLFRNANPANAAPCHNGHFYLLNPLTGDHVPINGMFAKENNRYIGIGTGNCCNPGDPACSFTANSSCADLSKWNSRLESYDTSTDPCQITRDSTISGSSFCIESTGTCSPSFVYDFRGAYHFGCSSFPPPPDFNPDRDFACSSGIIAWGPKTSPSAAVIQSLTGIGNCTSGTWSVISSTSTSTRPPQYPYRSWTGPTGANVTYPLIGWCDLNNWPNTGTDFLFTPICGTYCGDGQIQSPNTAGQNETCDDANDYGGDYCNQCNRTPRGTISAPLKVYVNENIEIRVNAADQDNDLGRILVYIKNIAPGSSWERIGNAVNCSGGTCSGSINWSSASSGDYYVRLDVYDANVSNIGPKCSGRFDCNDTGCGTGPSAWSDCDPDNQRDVARVSILDIPPNRTPSAEVSDPNDCVDPVTFDLILTDEDELSSPNGLIDGKFRIIINEKFDYYHTGDPNSTVSIEGNLAMTPEISFNSCTQTFGRYNFTDIIDGSVWPISLDLSDVTIICEDSTTPARVTFSNAKFLKISDFKNSGHDLPSYLQDLTADFIEYRADVWDSQEATYRSSKKAIYRSHLGQGAVADVSWNSDSLPLSLTSPALVDYSADNVTSCLMTTTGPCLIRGFGRTFFCPVNQTGQAEIYVDPLGDLLSPCNITITTDGVCGPDTDSTGNLYVETAETLPWFKTVNGDVYSRIGVSQETPGTAEPFLPFSTYYCAKKSGTFTLNSAAAQENLACSRFGWMLVDNEGTIESLMISYLDDLISRIDSGEVPVSNSMRNQGEEDQVVVYYNEGNFTITGDIKNQPNAGGIYIVYGGDLTVASNVQELEGFFIVLGDESNNGGGFIVEAGNSPLKIKGSVIALRCGNEPNSCIEFNRDLGAGNETDPAELIEYDPRYIVLFRDLLGELGNIQFTESGAR